MAKYDPITGDLLPEPAMKGGVNSVNSVESVPIQEELENLSALSREQLIALCRRFACQCGIAAMMTEAETAQAMMDVLAETALRPIVPSMSIKADIQARMNAISSWLDRVKGKPMQNAKIEANVNLGLSEILQQAIQRRNNRESIK